MKYFIKISTVCFVLLGASCNQVNDNLDPYLELRTLLNKIEFEGISVNTNEATFENVDERRSIITLPLLYNTIKEYQIDNAKNYLNLVFDMESKSLLTSVLLSSNSKIGISTGDFTGFVDIEFLQTIDYKVVKLDDPGSISLNFISGRIASSDIKYPSEKVNGSRVACSGFEDAVKCAGQKFEDAECCFEEAACYLTFIPCLIYRIIDCGINGCN